MIKTPCGVLVSEAESLHLGTVDAQQAHMHGLLIHDTRVNDHHDPRDMPSKSLFIPAKQGVVRQLVEAKIFHFIFITG